MKRKFDRLISADSHVNEPTDLWSKAMGKEYGERAPHLLEDYNGEHGRFYYTGLRVLKLGDDEDELRAMGVPVAAGYAPGKPRRVSGAGWNRRRNRQSDGRPTRPQRTGSRRHARGGTCLQ